MYFYACPLFVLVYDAAHMPLDYLFQWFPYFIDLPVHNAHLYFHLWFLCLTLIFIFMFSPLISLVYESTTTNTHVPLWTKPCLCIICTSSTIVNEYAWLVLKTIVNEYAWHVNGLSSYPCCSQKEYSKTRQKLDLEGWMWKGSKWYWLKKQIEPFHI